MNGILYIVKYFFVIFRRHYKLIDKIWKKTCLFDVKDNNMSSVHHVDIQNENAVLRCRHDFPNAMKLTIGCNSNDEYNNSVLTKLKDIISLTQITKLDLHLPYNSFSTIIELLHNVPKLHTFEIHCFPYSITDLVSIENSEIFRLLSSSNNI
jgi:hypothetical protein